MKRPLTIDLLLHKSYKSQIFAAAGRPETIVVWSFFVSSNKRAFAADF